MIDYKRIDKATFNLIQTIRSLGYGEIYGVQIELTGEIMSVPLGMSESILATLIDEGTQYIDVLTVHDRKPAMVETDFKLNGFSCRKKIKIPA